MPKPKKPKKSKIIQLLKLDLGCGQNCQVGFEGVDLYAPEVKHRLDLLKFPWPWKDGTVDEIHCSHFVEHIPHNLRWRFFEECYRIMKLGAIMRVFVPNWKSERAYGDMTHQWPPVSAMAFFYLDRRWREANKLNYGPYAIACNFETQCGPTAINPGFADRPHETQVFACQHYLEAYPDMWATLVKKEA